MTNFIVAVLVLFGLFFFFIGTVGVIRFPDALTRAHGAAKCDSLGAFLCVLAIVIYQGDIFIDIKIALVILFLWSTNPTATHVLAKAITRSVKKNKEMG